MFSRRPVAEVEHAEPALYEWPRGVVVAYCLPDVQASVLAWVRAGIDVWKSVCGVVTQEVSDPSLARVVVSFEGIDPAGNVLGLTELPADGRADARHTMKLNAAVDWSERELTNTAMHEFGHALGLEHSPAGVKAIMAPVLDQSIAAPQAWDVEQAVARYGPPKASTAPAPAPSPAAPAPTADPGVIRTSGGVVVIGGRAYLVTTTLTPR